LGAVPRARAHGRAAAPGPNRPGPSARTGRHAKLGEQVEQLEATNGLTFSPPNLELILEVPQVKALRGTG